MRRILALLTLLPGQLKGHRTHASVTDSFDPESFDLAEQTFTVVIGFMVAPSLFQWMAVQPIPLKFEEPETFCQAGVDR